MSTTETLTPKLAPATIEHKSDSITVRVQWQPHPDLDRLDACAWGLSTSHRALAERLVAAIDAGVIVTPGEPYTDTSGARGWHAHSGILARTMNADLTRLGY